MIENIKNSLMSNDALGNAGFGLIVSDFQTYFGERIPREKVIGVDFANKKIAGVYVCILKIQNEIYCVYVGETTRILGRLQDYTQKFQAGSTNDFKLQFFNEWINTWIKKEIPVQDHSLIIYFKHEEMTLNENKNVYQSKLYGLETMFINKWKPIINGPGKKVQIFKDEKQKTDLIKLYQEEYNKNFSEIVELR